MELSKVLTKSKAGPEEIRITIQDHPEIAQAIKNLREWQSANSAEGAKIEAEVEVMERERQVQWNKIVIAAQNAGQVPKDLDYDNLSVHIEDEDKTLAVYPKGCKHRGQIPNFLKDMMAMAMLKTIMGDDETKEGEDTPLPAFH
jgi:hypothetical protein